MARQVSASFHSKGYAMCEPITAATMMYASMAVSAATTAITFVGQQAMADAQYDAAVQNNAALRTAAITDMVQKGNDLNSREQQERASTALNINNQKLSAQRAAATAEATSEGAGLSFENLMADYDRQYLSYSDSQMQQLGFNVEQIQRNRESIHAQTQSRINSGWNSRPIAQPSLGLSLMEIGGDAVGSYGKLATKDPITGSYSL